MDGDRVDVALSVADVSPELSGKKNFKGGIHVKFRLKDQKWSVVRSVDQFKSLQTMLETEFKGVLDVPTLPVLPESPTDALVPLQSYMHAILNHPSIRTSNSVQQFTEHQERDPQLANVQATKRGMLIFKDGKPRKYEGVIENRVLRCMVQSTGVCEMAILLDGCEVTLGEDACSFQVTAKSIKEALGKAKKGNHKLPTSYSFLAPSSAERVEWVNAINAACKIHHDATFKVSGQLIVEVIEGKNLAAKDFHLLKANTSDPYVVLRIDCQQQKTRTIHKNLNPKWNEEFTFDIMNNQGILFVLLYDEDILKPSDSMGQVVFPLTSLTQRKTHDLWLPVLPRKPFERVSGEIHLRLTYEFIKEQAKAGPIFGTSLMEICDNPQLSVDGVPKFFVAILNYLEKTAMNEKGIFRISGSLNSVKELKQKIDEGKEINFEEFLDVNTVSGVLKLYLRELPVPLFTYENYSKLIEIASISNEKELLSELKSVLHVIPTAHTDMLKVLLPSLKKFSDNSAVNMMTTANLAIVFGPSLMRPQVDSFETVLHTVNITSLTSVLIDHNLGLFI